MCNTFVIARLLLPKRRKSTANIRTHKRKYLNAQKILAQDFKRNILAELRNTCRRLKVEIKSNNCKVSSFESGGFCLANIIAGDPSEPNGQKASCVLKWFDLKWCVTGADTDTSAIAPKDLEKKNKPVAHDFVCPNPQLKC